MNMSPYGLLMRVLQWLEDLLINLFNILKPVPLDMDNAYHAAIIPEDNVIVCFSHPGGSLC